MNLENYKKKISNLNINEQSNRDFYLRNLSIGKIYGPVTGYSSIDKPWLKYYSEETIKSTLLDLNTYDFLKQNNTKNMEKTALNYFGKKITFREMFNNIDITVKSLISMGIKTGDIVSICLPNIPEFVYIFYALSKIGAIANVISPSYNVNDIIYYINDVNSKLLITIDEIVKKLENIKNSTSIKNIITVPYSSSKTKKYLKIDNKDLDIITWNKFFDIGKNYNFELNEYSINNNELLIVYAGGITGNQKGVLLSNKNINSIVEQNMLSSENLQGNQKYLDVNESSSAYGIVEGLHLPLSLGIETILIPQFKLEEFDKLLLKYKPNYISGVPMYYNKIINSKKLEKKDLSFLTTCIVGGYTLDEHLEKDLNNFLKNHGCNYPIIKNYGMTETCGSICKNPNQNNVIGSVGIPFVKSTVSIFNPETNEELGYNQVGEICMTGPSIMMRYYDNELETKKIKKVHNDGKEWIHSGDLGYMTEDGNLFIVDKLKRVITSYDGFKIYSSEIERIINSHPNVKTCHVVKMPDIDNIYGQLPCVFISLNKKDINYEKFENEIYMLCEINLSKEYMPKLIRYKDDFSLTSDGKVNYLELENEILEEIKSNNKIYKKEK